MRILIINFYSPRNLGDLAILDQTLWLIRQAAPEAQVGVMVSDPQSLPAWLNVHWIPSWPLVARQRGYLKLVREAHEHADLILSLGGGYFFVHDLRPFSVWATISLLYALRWRKPVVCLPQSFGPFRYAYQAWLAAALLSRCAEVYLRDMESLQLFHSFAPSQAVAHFAPDTAFSLALRWDCPLKRAHSRPQIGVTIVDWSFVDPRLRHHQPRYELALVHVLSSAHQAFGAQVKLFLQCQSARRVFESDAVVTQRVYVQLAAALGDHVQIVNDLVTPLQALHAYGEMDALVATRLHSAIFAACAATPTLAIGYQPKTCATMRLLGQRERCLSLAETTEDVLWAKLRALWEERETLGVVLHHRAQVLGHQVANCIRSIVDRYRSK